MYSSTAIVFVDPHPSLGRRVFSETAIIVSLSTQFCYVFIDCYQRVRSSDRKNHFPAGVIVLAPSARVFVQHSPENNLSEFLLESGDAAIPWNFRLGKI